VLLPQVSASGGWDQTKSDGRQFSPLIGSGYSFDGDSDDADWNVTLRQTVFRWDQIVNLKRADKLVTKAEAVREAAQQDLVIRVAQRYFDVLAAEDRLTSIHADRTAIARQLEQAKQRFEVGLIAITDVQESQAAYDQAVADEIGAKRQLASAREFLREITGEYVTQLSAPKEDMPLRRPEKSEREWVDLSLSQNLSLVASRLDEELARDEISFRRNGHYPTLDLVARTGNQRSEGSGSTTFPGSSPGDPDIVEPYSSDDDRNFDSISLQFNIPLFAGGGTSSRVREAVYLHRASREQLQRVTRETERQSRDAYLGVLASRPWLRAKRHSKPRRPDLTSAHAPSSTFSIHSSRYTLQKRTISAAATTTSSMRCD
jgi:outer membrane protein